MTITRMALIVMTCVAAGVAVDVATDGGGPPREGTRAEASPLVTRAAVTTPPPRPASTPASLRSSAGHAPRRDDLERELTAALLPESEAARDLMLQQRLPDLVSLDPEAAVRFAEMQTEPGLRAQVLRQVALLWGALDAGRALDWARSLPDAAERDATLIDIANGLSSVDPARGVELREQFVSPITPDVALSNLVQQWAGYDFPAALAWATARPAGAQRDELVQRLVYVRAAAGDPVAAARLVSDSALTGAAKSVAVASVKREWEQRDAAAAQEWTRTLEPATSN